MSEWWTYSLSSFLLFAPRTYYRLFELYNEDIWPVQVIALALGAAVVVLLYRRAVWRGRATAAILAASWLWTAWAFHIQRYATINWAATYMAAGFAAQGLLLLWLGVIRNRLAPQPISHIVARAGLAMFVVALVVQPLLGMVFGRSWTQAEIFGIAPDPTAVATLGLLLTAQRTSWALLVLPVLWCAVTGATLWTMGAVDALLAPLLALSAIVLAVT
jgi:hypothetical protein